MLDFNELLLYNYVRILYKLKACLIVSRQTSYLVDVGKHNDIFNIQPILIHKIFITMRDQRYRSANAVNNNYFNTRL